MRAKRKRKIWRCFHCDEVFRSRKSAYAHFGPDCDCEKLPPACVDPLRKDEKARITELREAQDYAFHCQESANCAEERASDLERELDEFRRLTKCRNTHELYMKLDSEKGTLLTAMELIKAVRTKAPAVYAEVVQ
jgi:hypothetical protein